MMLWTKLQINYTGKPSKFTKYFFEFEYMNLNIWVEYRNLIQECLDSVSY